MKARPQPHHVGEVGEDRLAELGVSADNVNGGQEFDDIDFSDEEIETAGNIMLDCVDIRALMVQGMVESGATQDQAECIADAIPEETFRSLLVASLTGTEDVSGPEFDEAAATAASDCGLG